MVASYFSFLYQESCQVATAEIEQLYTISGVSNYQRALCSLMGDKNYSDQRSLVRLPFDEDLHVSVKEMVDKKQQLEAQTLIVVGIGGSSLGTRAVYQAIKGRLHTSMGFTPRVYFAETVDADRMATILTIVRNELDQERAVVVVVVTKSGTTTETVANFHVLRELLHQYRPHDYKKYFVMITDKGSPLWNFSVHEGYDVLEIPQCVGGRYSVFSPVGLFPLALLGIDIDALVQGAQEAVLHETQESCQNNNAFVSAALQYLHYKRAMTISDLFLFAVDLEAIGKWYRQLLAESIGKEFDRDGKKVVAGITPTVSIGSIDLHSLAQLYLGGPRDKFTTFVTIQKPHHTISINPDMPIGSGCQMLKNKDFATIMQALVEGTKKAYKQNSLPFCSIALPEKTERFIGQFLQFKMIEMMYLGFLLHVDPFDQPNVELYKKEVQKLLQS